MREYICASRTHWTPRSRGALFSPQFHPSSRVQGPPRAAEASFPTSSASTSASTSGNASSASSTAFFVDDDPSKQFTIEPLTADTVNQASVVITRAFAASPQYIPINECKTYCNDMLAKDDAEGIIFVGAISPGPDCEADTDSNSAPRVIATASLSFCDTSRENFKSLTPPEDSPYLCNIAVDPSFRRKGIARRMLSHVEDYCRQHGWKDVYLHVRLGDEAARSLYDTSGYKELASDSWLIKLQSRTPNALLCKQL